MRLFIYAIFLTFFFVSSEAIAQLVNIDSTAVKSKIASLGFQKPNKSGNKLKNTFYEGNIGLGSDYGLLPILINPTPPNLNSTLQGSFGFKIKILPFKSTFLYSTSAISSGLNNYFRLEFDVQKFIQILREEQMKQQQAIMAKKDSLLRIKQTIVQKIAFYEMSMKNKIVDSDAIKKSAEDSLKTKGIKKDRNGKDSGRTILYSKKDEMYLIKKDKKCIQDSLKTDKKEIKKRWRNKSDKPKKDSIFVDTSITISVLDTNSTPIKEKETEVAKSNKKLSLDSLKNDKNEIAKRWKNKFSNVRYNLIPVDSNSTPSKKTDLKIARTNKKIIMDSLGMYKIEIKKKLKKKKQDEKKEKKALKKAERKRKKEELENKKKHASDSLKQYQNLKIEKPSIDSLKLDSLKNNSKLDSLEKNKEKAYEMDDAARQKYNDMKTELKEVEKQIADLDLSSFVNLEDEKQVLKEKKKAKFLLFLSYIKKLEIGMTNPNHSYFLANNIPVTGINFEYGKNKFYLAFTYGKTVNNILPSNNLLKNLMNTTRNVYNFFDFTNIEQGRRIAALKVGYGEKEKSHLFVGGLFGMGKSSYISTSNTDTEKNYVFEIDGRVIIKEKHSIDMVYGRSALQVNEVNFEKQSSVFNQLFGFSDRTNAAFIQNNLNFFNNKTNVKLTFRYIDPFFISYGVGFLRNDNIRYEAKLKQKINKKITIGGFVRREEDNILNMYAYKNLLMSYGIDVSYRLTKKTMLKVDYRPIIQNIKLKEENIDITNHNQIVNFIATHTNRIKNTTINLTGVYSYYNLQNDSTRGIYQNFNLSTNIAYKKKWENAIIFNRFQTNDTMSVADANIIENAFTFFTKRIDITGTVRYSFSKHTPSQVGYGLKTSVKLGKNWRWDLSGEKLIIGDFYNNLLINDVNKYPYFYSTTLTFFW